MDILPEDAPAPRLCHLFKWPDFDGYGFNLHGEKSKPGQYIGKVDKDSPSELAGLKANDRIIEVNGTNIANENHKQVVQRIKAIPNETKLLVLDNETEQYYKSRNIVVNGSMANVHYLKTPVPRPTMNNNPDELESNGIGGSQSDEDGKSHVSDSGSGSSLPSKTDSLKKDSQNGYYASSIGESPTPPESTASPSPPPNLPPMSQQRGSPLDLNLNMTAQQMRAMLAERKKQKLDPKNQKIDLRKKYDIIQTL